MVAWIGPCEAFDYPSSIFGKTKHFLLFSIFKNFPLFSVLTVVKIYIYIIKILYAIGSGQNNNNKIKRIKIKNTKTANWLLRKKVNVNT